MEKGREKEGWPEEGREEGEDAFTASDMLLQ